MTHAGLERADGFLARTMTRVRVKRYEPNAKHVQKRCENIASWHVFLLSRNSQPRLAENALEKRKITQI